MNGLDVDAIVERKGEASDVVPQQHCLDLLTRQFAEEDSSSLLAHHFKHPPELGSGRANHAQRFRQRESERVDRGTAQGPSRLERRAEDDGSTTLPSREWSHPPLCYPAR